jgi:MFS family permease
MHQRHQRAQLLPAAAAARSPLLLLRRPPPASPLLRRAVLPPASAASPSSGGAGAGANALGSSGGSSPGAPATSTNSTNSATTTAAAGQGSPAAFGSVDAAAALEAAAVGVPPPPLQPEGRIAQAVAAAAAAAGATQQQQEDGRSSPSAAAAAAAAAAASNNGNGAGPLRLVRTAAQQQQQQGNGDDSGTDEELPLLRSFVEEDEQQQPASGTRHHHAAAGPRQPSSSSLAAAAANNGSSSHDSGEAPSSTAAAAPAGAATEGPPPPPPAAKAKKQSASAAANAAAPIVAGVPPPVVVLSLVSMALTSASCVFNTLLPIYMVAELKMPMASMGAFEGLLEAFSYAVRMASGVVSDRLGSRKAAIAMGFAMGAAAKLGLSFASTLPQLFAGKALDRLANGVQAAPRDALIGDLSPAKSRSACFGFAQSLRKWGSFVGAGLAFLLMKGTGGNYRAIFLAATGVTVLATVAFVLLVPGGGNSSVSSSAQPSAADNPPQKPTTQSSLFTAPRAVARSLHRTWQDVRQMSADFWRTLAVICMYGLGHVNESLLEARAMEVGFGKAESALVVAALCFAVFCCAYPLGRLDDAWGHRTTFGLGMAALIAGDLCLVLSSTALPWAVFAATAFWGAHVAVLQGPMLSVVVGLAPAHLKGTAFGIFYSAMALVAVAANTAYGRVWQAHGAPAAYGLSACVVAFALLVGAPLLLPRSRAMDGPRWRGGGGTGGAGAGGKGGAPAPA